MNLEKQGDLIVLKKDLQQILKGEKNVYNRRSNQD